MEGQTIPVVGGRRSGARRLVAVFAAPAMLGALMVSMPRRLWLITLRSMPGKRVSTARWW